MSEEPQQPPHPPQVDRPTILVVDDVESNRDLITRRLKHDYRVLEAEDGPAALELVQSETIDLIVLDVMMPGLTGIEVLRKLRRTYSTTELPIIMATAKDQSEDVVEALDNGANDYVTKPFDFAVILARIQAQLRMTESAEKAVAARAARHGKPEAVSIFGALKAGMVLASKYRLESEIGSGNFGAVWKAQHETFQQPVAIKILQTMQDSEEDLERFKQEGTSAFRLQHPNAVRVLDFDITSEGLAFMVMELLEGHSLEAELLGNRRMTPHRAAEILFPVCEVLAEAHSLGIIHRDIKPANIYLHRARQGEVVKVLDFGIAKLVGDAAMEKNLTVDEGILGTPAYMAPERLLGKSYDGRADAYGVGIMLYQILAGRGPFQTEGSEAMAVAMMHVTTAPAPLRSLRPDLSVGLEAAVMAALAKDPANRPDVSELACSYAQALGVKPPESLRERLEQPIEAAEIFSEPPELPGSGLPGSGLPGSGLPGSGPPGSGRQETIHATPVRIRGSEDRPFAFQDLLTPPGASSQDLILPPLYPTAKLAEPWTREPPARA